MYLTYKLFVYISACWYINESRETSLKSQSMREFVRSYSSTIFHFAILQFSFSGMVPLSEFWEQLKESISQRIACSVGLKVFRPFRHDSWTPTGIANAILTVADCTLWFARDWELHTCWVPLQKEGCPTSSMRANGGVPVQILLSPFKQ